MTADYLLGLCALEHSHDRLVEVVASSSTEELSSPSYCSAWTIAQVLSHLGSGGEIFVLRLDAALSSRPGPGRDESERIWYRWNALGPKEMADQCLTSDERSIQALHDAGDSLAGLKAEFMGRTLDAAQMIGMRLNEHAIHLWDLEVTRDPDAVIAPEAAAILVDRVPFSIGRMASGPRPKGLQRLRIETADPRRHFMAELGIESEPVTLVDPGVASDDTTVAHAGATLALGSEALVRLVTGRLDPRHTPASLELSGPVDLDALRMLFPGY